MLAKRLGLKALARTSVMVILEWEMGLKALACTVMVGFQPHELDIKKK